ncbi:MAG: adenosylhomocysteinase [Peptococcaceae bacterium]|jgi:adenosylhomocysteinase|nr:adenosylhomocysteinase [Peptococcaceae bacterium]
MESSIRDLTLAPSGQQKIDWVSAHMPVLNRLRAQFENEKPFAGKKIVICLHLEAKTAYLALTLQFGGAQVCVAASNPLSTQDDVVAALVQNGITAHAWYGASDEEYERHLHSALDFEPDLIIDDGGDLVATVHRERRELLNKICGGAEETTTGLLRLRAMDQAGELKFPMMAVNDAESKYLFDNRYGTGQSVWDGIMRTTNLVVAGKTVVVAGYGWCGKGVSLRAKGLGARVVITEVQPIRANEAWMDGFEVMPMAEAAKRGDFFITLTGNKDVIRREHFQAMKDGAILCNAGHFDVEINKTELTALSQNQRTIRHNIQAFELKNGKKIYLLAEGRLVNLAAGDGHPAEVMDMSFAIQTLSLKYLIENSGQLKNHVYRVTPEIDQQVARLRLESLGLSIDILTEEQEQYLRVWHE